MLDTRLHPLQPAYSLFTTRVLSSALVDSRYLNSSTLMHPEHQSPHRPWTHLSLLLHTLSLFCCSLTSPAPPSHTSDFLIQYHSSSHGTLPLDKKEKHTHTHEVSSQNMWKSQWDLHQISETVQERRSEIN